MKTRRQEAVRKKGWVRYPVIRAWWLLVLGAACGRTGLEVDREGGAASFRDLPECGEARWVLGGYGYIGQFEDTDFEEHPGLEPFTGSVPSMFLRVDGFYLDEDEASVACYDVCVAEGACPVRTFEPGDRRFPASVSVAGAEAFCAFRGGRLPTLVELARASHPDVVAVGDPALVEAYVACAGVGVYSGGFDTEACAWLLARSPLSDLPELPIASERRDTGPFGHRDLFGAQYEVTSSHGLGSQDSLPTPFSDDPGTFGSGPVALFSPVAALRDARDRGRITATPQLLVFPEVVENWAPLFGVRCAYD